MAFYVLESGGFMICAATYRTDGAFRVQVVVCIKVSNSCQWGSLTKTFSSRQSITEVSMTRRPLRRSWSARVVMVLAWGAFWLNSAFLPCCDAFAAAFDNHADDDSLSLSSAHQVRDADKTHPPHPLHSPGSPCDHTLNAGPAINGEYAGLPTDRIHRDGVATFIPFAFRPTVVNHSANLAPRDFRPPPPPATVRLYLHTQRLLI